MARPSARRPDRQPAHVQFLHAASFRLRCAWDNKSRSPRGQRVKCSHEQCCYDQNAQVLLRANRFNVFTNRKPWEKTVLLKDYALWSRSANRMPLVKYFAICWKSKSSNHVKECRFPTPRGPNDADKFAAVYGQGDVVQGYNLGSVEPARKHLRDISHVYRIHVSPFIKTNVQSIRLNRTNRHGFNNCQ